ncbi:MAG: hypothetical protein QOG89_2217, partial [Thermomicrobiales bacterium]|nr:hypothetical protein [Thermomicrobiales bacterium]
MTHHALGITTSNASKFHRDRNTVTLPDVVRAEAPTNLI